MAHDENSIPQDWHIGDIILDQYEVKDCDDRGGMGRVFQVHHRGWGMDLAVKSPRPELFAREDGKENFIREAETWMNLNLHPNIVSCHYVSTLGGIPHIFAEYVTGGNLADWIDWIPPHGRRLYEGGHKRALERILDIAIQFAWGLHFAHEQKLVHQDVKPANVMMTPEGIAKVMDFGLAQARVLAGEASVQKPAGQSMIVPGVGLMTREYCSPEQAHGQPLSLKTDIWSWRVSVMELFMGGRAWASGVAAREVLASYKRPDAAIPAMPVEVMKLLGRCFQRQPEERPASMLEVADELTKIYARLRGQRYPREIPRPAEAVADSLNNRALSLFDLGSIEKAKYVWENALQKDPHHLEANYNRGLVSWRRGELLSEMLIQQLEGIYTEQKKRWYALYLLSQLHLERGDTETALPLLLEVDRHAPGKPEVRDLLEQVQFGKISGIRCLDTSQEYTDEVTSVSLNSDQHDHLALAGTADGLVWLWDIAARKHRHILKGHTRKVTSVSLSVNGHLALSGSEDETVRLWDTTIGKCLYTFRGHTGFVTSVSLSADGRLALSGSEDQTMRLWQDGTTSHKTVFQRHNDVVTAVCLSNDSHLALSGCRDHRVRPWDVVTGKCLRVFEGHTAAISSVALSLDGHRALSGSEDQTMRLWEVDTGKCLCTFRGCTSRITSVSFGADDHLAFAGNEDGTVWLWEASTGQCLRILRGHAGIVNSVCSTMNSAMILSGSADRTIRLWALPRELFRCPLYLSQAWSYADVSDVEAQVLGLLTESEQAYNEGRLTDAVNRIRTMRDLRGWERAPKGREIWAKLSLHCSRVGFRTGWLAKIFQGHREAVTSVCLSADSRLALSGSKDGSVRVWDVASGQCPHTIQHRHQVTSVCLSGNGRQALVGSEDRLVRLWEITTGKLLHTFEEHGAGITSVCLSMDGKLALSGSKSGYIRLWDIATGRCLYTFQEHRDAVTSVSLSADGRLALSGSRDETVRLWDIATGRCLYSFRGHTGGVLSACMNASGDLALSGGADQKIQFWDIPGQKQIRSLTSEDSILAVSLSADGRFALVGNKNQTVNLWELVTGKLLYTLRGHTGQITSVSLSADGRFALSGSTDQTVLLWELDWELEAHNNPVDWDERALPYLQTFLALHTPYAAKLSPSRTPSKREIKRALTRQGRSSWSTQNFEELMQSLQRAGYGWLQADGVWRKLQTLDAIWQGPPPFNVLRQSNLFRF